MLVSGFFCCAVEDPLLELGPDPDGGGDFNRGDVGQCGVVSPDPVPPFGALGRRDTASDTPPACNCGAFAADSALCMAAADGWVEMGVERGCGRLSFRTGEVLRDVRGLVPANGEPTGRRLLDGCFRNGGGCIADAIDDFRGSLAFRRAVVFAVGLLGSTVSA